MDLFQSTVKVLLGQMNDFEKRLSSLNKKAAKFGLPLVDVVSSEDIIYDRKTDHHDDGTTSNYLVRVGGDDLARNPVIIKHIDLRFPVLKLGRWGVVGHLESVKEQNLVFTLSNQPHDVEYVESQAANPIHCDHCNKNRKRKDAYILKDVDAGGYKRVGSSCLKDFTGIDPAAVLFLANMQSFIDGCDDEFAEYERSGRSNAINIHDYLTNVSFCIRNFGFTSATKARDIGGQSSADDAMAIDILLRNDHRLETKFIEQLPEHKQVAEHAITWMRSKTSATSFEDNLKILLLTDVIEFNRKHLTILAALIPSYQRSMQAVVQRAANPSCHFGQAKDKCERQLRLTRLVTITTAFGPSAIVLFQDEAGNQVKWKTAAVPQELGEANVGKAFLARFSIKGHEDYKGIAQTVVTHLKFVSWADSALVCDGKDGAL